MNLRRMFWVFRKELNIYLTTPLAYILAGAFLVISGFMFYVLVDYFARSFNQLGQFGSQGMDLTQMIMRPFLSNLTFMFLIITPLICMRLFSEERRHGTLEMLMTSPVTTLEIVLGKYLAGVAMNFFIFLVTLVFPVFLVIYGNPDLGPVFSGYLGVLLLIMGFVALSLFASAITSNALIAAMFSFGILLMLWIIGWVSFSQFGTSTWLEVVKYISVPDHLDDFFKGVVDTKHVVYFLSLALVGLFFTYGAVESQRWRSAS